MAVFDLFSRRKRGTEQKTNDVLCYDEIRHELRIQLLHAFDDARERIYGRTIPAYRAIGTEGEDIFSKSCQILRRELGLGQLINVPRRRVRSLDGSRSQDLADEFTAFFENCETEQVLDSIEVAMALIQEAEQNRLLDHECNSRTVITEINRRLLDHGVGYQYESGQIIKQTNSAIHSDVITPSLILLSDPDFAGANEEFLKAHEHYRHRRHAECLVECLKTFESTMKIICDLNGWSYKPTDTAKSLIQTSLNSGLVPTFTQQQLTSLRTLLESGVPTVRNKQAGHGQGSTPRQVSPHLARFGLNSTAAIVVLLVESHFELSS